MRHIAETLLGLSNRAEMSHFSQPNSPLSPSQMSASLNDSVASNSSPYSQSGRRAIVTGYVECEVVGMTLSSYTGCTKCKTKMQEDDNMRMLCPNGHTVDSRKFEKLQVSVFVVSRFNC